MRPISLRASLLVALCLCALGAGAAAQAGPEDLAEDALAALKKGLKAYDMPAVEEALVDLDSVYDKVSAKTVKDIEKAVTSVFKTKPRASREQGDDPRDELIDAYHLAIGVVFERPGGDDLLLTGLKQRHLDDWPAMRAAMIEGLGYRRDPKLVSTFADLTEDEQPAVAAAAAEALAELSEQPLPVRRQAVDALIDSWSEAAELARREQSRKKTETTARDHLEAVEGPFELALRKLTRQSHDGPEAWESWFKKDGGRNDW